MRKILALALLATTVVSSAGGQATTRDSVLAAVEGLFESMAERDTALALRVTDPAGRIMGIDANDPSAIATRQMHGAWARSLLGQDGPAFLERMWQPEVMVRGPLAVVWSEYDFHIDGKFSHCGVDAFTLFRERGTWRIVNTAYTVQRESCEPSPLGPPAGSDG